MKPDDLKRVHWIKWMQICIFWVSSSGKDGTKQAGIEKTFQGNQGASMVIALSRRKNKNMGNILNKSYEL